MNTVRITDRILYTQLLTRAGYKVIAINKVVHDRGGDVTVEGVMERAGKREARVRVGMGDIADHVAIAGTVYRVRVNDDGSFELEALGDELDDYGDPIGWSRGR